MKLYVGLDVHSKESEYVITNKRGQERGSGRIATTRKGLSGWAKTTGLRQGTEVAMESGPMTLFVARQLERIGLVPRVFDAYEVRQKAHRPTQKSDRRDALELCHGLRQGLYRSRVVIPTLEQAALREELSRRRHFVRLAAAQITAAKRLMRSAGYNEMRMWLKQAAGWERCMGLLGRRDELLKVHVSQHYAVWQMAQKQVDACTERLPGTRRVYEADILRLQTIPGVGPIVATTAMAVIGDIGRFGSAKELASYAGVVPSSYSSGEQQRMGHITKRGSAELRAMLCEAAQHAGRATHPLNPYFRKLCAKHGYKIAIVAIAHRLLRIIYGMLTTQTDFDVTRVGVEVGPFTTTTSKMYRLKRSTVAAQHSTMN